MRWCFALAFLFAGIAWPQDRKPQILLVGVFHLGGTTDLFSGEHHDWRKPERERQVLEVVEKLKTFQPTKVALEFVDGQSKAAEQYSDYVQGRYELKTNEIDLIGFRLAKALGHTRVYGIDDRTIPWDYGALQKFGTENGFTKKFEEFAAAGKQAMDWQNEMVRRNSLLVVLRELNSPDMLRRRQSFEMKMLDINKGDDHAGAELVSNWYKRNLRIYANLRRIAAPGDRILVLIGQGHAAVMRPMLADSTDIELVDGYAALK